MLRPILASLLLLPTLAAALSPPPPPPPPPQVWIAPGQGLKPIQLGEVDIQVRTHGFVARTSIELRFDNPNSRVLEGEFVFPLAAGQTVAGYALEVNGALREGVVVDKQTARVAFEETSRRQIDPGLAELTAGNVFRTRLYPIPAQGSKRVRLHLEAVLADGGDHWRYLLPLHFKDPVGRMHVRAESALAKAAPAEEPGVAPELRFERSGQTWIAEFTRTKLRPRSELAFRIPKATDATQAEAIDWIDPAWRSVVALIDSGRPTQTPPQLPKRIAIWYDASASARDRDRTREADALKAWAKALGQAEIALVAFRNDADPPQAISLRGGDAGALLRAIAALPLDGGSSYGAIDLRAHPPVDQVLLIGDGLSNFGPSEPSLVQRDRSRPPLAVLHAAQRADHARLRRIARAGGGEALDLATLSPAEASRRLLARGWRLLEARASGGECRQIAPAAPAPVAAKLSVYARCRGKGELLLRFGDGAGTLVERRIGFGQLAPAGGALADSVHRLWAQAWLAELASAGKPDEAAMAQIGKRYGVVTTGTSLLVLDRIEDYVRYRVEPREEALRDEYRRLLAAQPKVDPDPGRDARLASLVQRWREFRDYHAASYPGIESLLAGIVQAELAQWPGGSKPHAAGLAQAQALLKQSQALLARWPVEGAEEASRARWEKEAARIVFAVEALRTQRAEIPMVAGTPGDDYEAADHASGLEQAAPAVAETMSDAALATAGEPPREAAPPAPPASPAPAASAPARQLAANGDSESGAERARNGEAHKAISDARSEQVAATRAQIELAGWNPDAPYLDGIRDAADPYRAYLAVREAHATMPAFYLDVADFLRSESRQPRLALRVLSNLAELDVENTALVRVLAYRLAQWELYALAVPQFEAALAQRAEEPQSYRDLALALARMSNPDRARAVALLWQVAIGEWHGRFPDIEVIALHEMNDVLAQAGRGEKLGLDKLGIPAELLDPVAVGLRVVLSWDADNTDIDLWVVDPSGDKAVYSQPRTRTGGHLSRDFTGGYGPEVYTIRRPLPGTYVVMANYFGDRRQSLTGPVTIQLEFQTRFGTRHGQRAATTRRLESGSQTIEIGKFKVGAE